MKIFVPCYSRDLYLAAATLHSIRMFSGHHLKVVLIPDHLQHNPFLQLIADHYDAAILQAEDLQDPLLRDLHGGWGFSKLIPFFDSSADNFLCVDADCIVLGDLRLIARQLQRYAFVSDLNRLVPSDDKHFFELNNDLAPIPERRLPLLRRRFVSGIFAGRPGILNPQHLRELLAMSRSEPSPLFPGDQGILNYWAVARRPDHITWLSQHMQVYAISLLTPSAIRSPQEQLCLDLFSIAEETQFKSVVLERRLQPFVLHYAGGSKPFVGVGNAPPPPMMNRFRRWSNEFLKRRCLQSRRLQILIDDIWATNGLPVKHLVRDPSRIMKLDHWF